jgi:hypothetical protein
MRPRWFSPDRDLQPILRRFNAESQSDVDNWNRLNTQAREESVKRGARLNPKLAMGLVRQVRQRAQRGAILRFQICRELRNFSRVFHLSEQRVWRAWSEVWSVLQGLESDIPKRIGSCGWCGRLFWRARLRERYCSSICRIAPKILHGKEAALGKVLMDELEEIRSSARVSKNRFGAYDTKLRALYHSIRQFLLTPMLRRVAPIRLPARVEDATAFVLVWAFVFDTRLAMIPRVFVCPHCKRIACRKDRRRVYCEDRCRKKADLARRRRHAT